MGIRHLPVYANGSHLTFWWYKTDAGPIGPTSSTPVKADLWRNQQKTEDSLQNMRTGWQYKMGWAAYNNHIPVRLKQLSEAGVATLFVYANFADALGNKYGLDHDWSEQHINAIIPESLRQIVRVSNGTEGALEQNAT